MGRVVALVVAVLLAGVVAKKANADTWSVMTSNIMTIAMGLDFMDPLNGVVSGAQNGIGPEILRTTDGGQSWEDVDHESALMIYMCMAFTDGNNGMTAGLGVLTPSSAYTTDSGATWTHSEVKDVMAAYQDCEPVPAVPKMIVLPGDWVDLKSGNDDGDVSGIAITHDAGKTLSHKPWGINTQARYTSFASEKVGWISGGTWPQQTEDNRLFRRYSMHVGLKKNVKGIHSVINMIHDREVGDDDQFLGILAKTSDGGDTWTVQFNETGLRYFNGIYAVDEQNVWAVCEGDVGAWIMHTSDGGKTWEEQYHNEKASMITVKFFDKNEGWVAGALAEGMFGKAGMWHTVDGGKTWDLTEISNYYVNDLDLLDRDHVYATAFSFVGDSAVLEYIPSK